MPRPIPFQSHLTARKLQDSWNGWFVVALFHEGPLAWLKTHAYRPATANQGYPIAALEGFGATGEGAWMAGLRGLRPPYHQADEGLLCMLEGGAGLSAGRTEWSWAGESVLVSGELLGRPATLTAERIALQPMRWANLPGLLHFYSMSADIVLQWGDERWRGAGLVEHAWGGYLPFPAEHLLPGHWQWDVLWEEGAERIFHVGLSARLLGRLGYALRAFSDRGGAVRSAACSPVDIVATEGEIPTVWTGSIGDQAYRAERTGRALLPFPRGAYFGFSYEMRGKRGIGFAERISSPFRDAGKTTVNVPAYSIR